MSQLSPNKARTPQKSFPTRLEHHSATLAHSACEVRVKNTSGGSPNSFWEGVGELPGLSWARLGHSCALLGRSWATFGRFWGALGSLLVASGCAWAPPGSILGGLGRLRHRFWMVLAAIWGTVFEYYAPIAARSPGLFSHVHFVLPLLLNNARMPA